MDCVSLSLSLSLPVFLSIFLTDFLSACLSIRLSVSFGLYVSLSRHLSLIGHCSLSSSVPSARLSLSLARLTLVCPLARLSAQLVCPDLFLRWPLPLVNEPGVSKHIPR